MRSLVNAVLGALGALSLAAAMGCAFLTFATNDYRPILAEGAGLAVFALFCFGALIRRGGREWWLGVALAVVTLGELLRRTAFYLG